MERSSALPCSSAPRRGTSTSTASYARFLSHHFHQRKRQRSQSKVCTLHQSPPRSATSFCKLPSSTSFYGPQIPPTEPKPSTAGLSSRTAGAAPGNLQVLGKLHKCSLAPAPAGTSVVVAAASVLQETDTDWLDNVSTGGNFEKSFAPKISTRRLLRGCRRLGPVKAQATSGSVAVIGMAASGSGLSAQLVDGVVTDSSPLTSKGTITQQTSSRRVRGNVGRGPSVPQATATFIVDIDSTPETTPQRGGIDWRGMQQLLEHTWMLPTSPRGANMSKEGSQPVNSAESSFEMFQKPDGVGSQPVKAVESFVEGVLSQRRRNKGNYGKGTGTSRHSVGGVEFLPSFPGSRQILEDVEPAPPLSYLQELAVGNHQPRAHLSARLPPVAMSRVTDESVGHQYRRGDLSSVELVGEFNSVESEKNPAQEHECSSADLGIRVDGGCSGRDSLSLLDRGRGFVKSESCAMRALENSIWGEELSEKIVSSTVPLSVKISSEQEAEEEAPGNGAVSSDEEVLVKFPTRVALAASAPSRAQGVRNVVGRRSLDLGRRILERSARKRRLSLGSRVSLKGGRENMVRHTQSMSDLWDDDVRVLGNGKGRSEDVVTEALEVAAEEEVGEEEVERLLKGYGWRGDYNLEWDSSRRALPLEEERKIIRLLERGQAIQAAQESLSLSLGRSADLREVAEHMGTTLGVVHRDMQVSSAARNKLVMHNVGLVVSIASMYRNMGYGVDFVSLCQRGVRGLYAAADKFNSRRKCKFITFATLCVRTIITREIASSMHIRAPTYSSYKFLLMQRMERVLEVKLKRKPTEVELAAATKVGLPQLQVLRRLFLEKPASLQDDVAGIGLELAEVVPDSPTSPEFVDAVLQHVEPDLVRYALDDVINSLKPKEAFVIRQRFGLDGNGERSLADVGRNLSISREMVRKYEARALAKLQIPERVELFHSNLLSHC